ncbi:MAG: MBG domain-containing protein, partial [Chitinophagaceae bacterium]
YTLNGFVNGDNTAVVSGSANLSTAATASSKVGSYPIQLTLGSLSASNYNFSLAEGTLDINKATLTVKADNKSRNYGNPNPDFSATISGFVNGEVLETSGVSGKAAMTTLADVNSITGDYDIDVALGSLTSANYEFTFSKGKLTVGKATITVTAVNKNRIYGQANPAFTYTYNGFINGENLATSDIKGEPASATTAAVSSGVGDYDIVPEIGTLTSNKYQFAFAKGVLSIQQAVLTVTANGAARIYGSANPSFTATYSGFVNGEELSTSDVKGTPSLTSAAVASTNVGNYDINAAIGTLTSRNYSFRFVTGVLKIEQAKVLVTANNASRIYGAENPKFTVTYSGFANNETLATAGISGEPLLQTVATKATGIGSYAIEAAAGTLTSGNYQFEFATGTLTIGKATLEVRVNNQQRIYGQSNPALTVSYAGFVNGENEQSSQLTGAPVVSTLANEKSEAGTYTIEANQGTLAAPNYDFNITFGRLTIG